MPAPNRSPREVEAVIADDITETLQPPAPNRNSQPPAPNHLSRSPSPVFLPEQARDSASLKRCGNQAAPLNQGSDHYFRRCRRTPLCSSCSCQCGSRSSRRDPCSSWRPPLLQGFELRFSGAALDREEMHGACRQLNHWAGGVDPGGGGGDVSTPARKVLKTLQLLRVGGNTGTPFPGN